MVGGVRKGYETYLIAWRMGMRRAGEEDSQDGSVVT